MSSFLVNTALILAMSCAVIQFCASAFSSYASSSMIFGIFGSQVSYCPTPRELPTFAPGPGAAMLHHGAVLTHRMHNNQACSYAPSNACPAP